MGNNNSVPPEKEDSAISYLHGRLGNTGGNADQLLVKLIAEEFGDVSESRSPRSVSEKAQNITRRLRRKLLSRNEEDAKPDRAKSSASFINYVAMETEVDGIMDAPVAQQTTDTFLQLRKLHTRPQNEPFTAIVELSPKSQNVAKPETEMETTMKDVNDLSVIKSSTAKDDAENTVPERDIRTSIDDVKSVCTAFGENIRRFGIEPISTAESVIGVQEHTIIVSDIPDVCCDKEVNSNSEVVQKEEKQAIDQINDKVASSKEALGTTETKPYDAMKQTSLKHKMYIDRMKAIAAKHVVVGDGASQSVLLDKAVMSDINVIRKVHLPTNNAVFSSNMVGSHKNDKLSVKEIFFSQTNKGNAVETPRPKQGVLKDVPAKKYGGINHMSQFEIENDIRMKWMKIITASRLITDSFGGRRTLDKLKKFDAIVIRNMQLSRQGNEYSSNMISPKTFPSHKSELAYWKDDFGNSTHIFTFGDLSTSSENVIPRYKVNRLPVNRSLSDGQLLLVLSTQDNHTKHEEANQSKYVIGENSKDCSVFESHKQDIAQESVPSSQCADDEFYTSSKDDNLKHVLEGKTDDIDDVLVQTKASGLCKETAIYQNQNTNENFDAVHIIPAKRFGSLEHMKKIKMENAIKMKRLKNIIASGASRVVTRGVAPKAESCAMSDVTKHEQTRQSRRDDESGYDKRAAENHNCGPTSFKPYGNIDIYEKHFLGNNYCEPVSRTPHSDDMEEPQSTATRLAMSSRQSTPNSSCKPPLISQRQSSEIDMNGDHIISAKKYGGLEHMQKIKMENAIKLQRLKNVQASSYGQRSLSTSSRGISHIHTSEMQDYHKANANNDSPKGGNLTGQRLQTWHTPSKEFSYSEKQADEKPIPYGSVAHFQKIQRDNAKRLRRMKDIHTRVDTWKTTENSCNDLDSGKEHEYGSVAHFRMVQRKNATINHKIGAITSKLDTWKEPNPGSEYSMQRGAVGDPRKFGSVAHFLQAKQQNASRTSRLKQTTSKLNTWQPRYKMAALSTPRQTSKSRQIGQMKSLTISVLKATSKIDTGLEKASKTAVGQVASWSRHLKDVRSPNPNLMKIPAIAANPKSSHAIMSGKNFNHKRESNNRKLSSVSQRSDLSAESSRNQHMLPQRSDKSALTRRKPQVLPAQNLVNHGITLSAREFECIEHRLRHPDNKIQFPCNEAEVDVRLKELLTLLRVSIFAKTTRLPTCDGGEGDGGFYVSPCDSFLADEAAMEMEYEMEQRALIAGNDLVNFVPRPRPTINKHGAPPTKIPKPVLNVLEKIMQSRVHVKYK